MMAVLAKQEFHVSSLPKPEEIKKWKKTYMNIWLYTIDETGPTEDYRKEREQILIKTFDNLIKLARKGKYIYI